jgi:hypothetical protein
MPQTNKTGFDKTDITSPIPHFGFYELIERMLCRKKISSSSEKGNRFYIIR